MRSLLLLAGAVCLLLSAPAAGMEVSEVTVDFPLAPVLALGETTQAPASPGQAASAGISSPVPHPGWEESWFEYRREQLRGNAKGAEEQLEKVMSFRLERGIPDLYLPAAALLYEAAQASRQSRFDDALRLIEQARRLAPSDPAPHFQKAQTIWRENRLHFLSSLEAYLDGWALRLAGFRTFFPWAVNLVVWLATAALLAAVAFILALGVHVFPRVAHDLSHLTANLLWPWYLAPPLLLVILLVTGAGFLWWLLVAPLLMVAHLAPRERIALAAACLLLLALPVLVQTLSLAETYYSGSRVRLLYEAERGGDGPGRMASLEPLLADPADFRARGVAALLHKRGGDLTRAETELRAAAKAAPSSPLLLNNLGNIALARGDVEEAIRQYQAALRASDEGTIHFNLSQALRQNLQLEEGAREFAVAQGKDPAVVNEYASPLEGGKRLTADILGARSEFTRGALVLDSRGSSFRDSLWRGLLPGVSFAQSVLLIPALAFFVLAGWTLPRSLQVSSRCPKCGRRFCPRCIRPNKERFCAQCHQIFVVRAGVDPTNRVRKMMQIMNFRKRRGFSARVGTILLPGLGHAALGSPLASLGLLVVSSAFWSAWVMWHGLFRSATQLPGGAEAGSRIAFFVLFGLFYLMALRNIGRRLEEV